jgi:hypothetical protein
MSSSQRQEVFNVILAQLLQERGAVVAPESILYTGTQRTRQMPDVIVNFQGLRTAIEGEVAAPDAQKKALDSATRRVETGVAHIGVGVVYPASLRSVDFANLKNALAQATLQITVTTEAGNTGFTKGDVDYLERALRSTFEQLIKEDVVAESVALLDVAVDQFAGAALANRGNWGRITQALSGSITDAELDQLTDVQRGANCRIGGLVLINAMIFHDILSGHYRRVTPLANILAQKKLDVFADEWRYVLDEINFYSIFHLAREIFINLSRASWGIPEALTLMGETALKISERRAALRHDLMGRVYHRLLAEAKYLGTYYTSIPAATLLLKLALRPEGWSVQWDDVEQVGALRIADLSCGTGTLLMAAADTLIDNHVSTAAGNDKPVDLVALHRQIAESILYGYDVLPSAIHLTASTLALRTPEVPFKKMNLFSLPLGGPDHKLGSIEFLQPSSMLLPFHDLFGAVEKTHQVTGQSMEEMSSAPYPDLDLCVMNPPFVRSVGGNLLFGSMPDAIRSEMQTKLKKLVKSSGVMANITAGLGSVFIAIGDRNIKPGGRLALVLPKALLSGISWGESRRLVNQKYRIDYVVVSHDAQRWNFSDSTDLSEVLLVATKNEGSSTPDGHKTIAVNLWRNPTTALEALAIASQVLASEPPDLVTGQGAVSIMLRGEKAGEIVVYGWEDMRRDWFMPGAFAQADLTRNAYHLLAESLRLPGNEQVYPLPLTPLSDLGVLGPDRRDIHDGFELTEAPTTYPTFWGHDANAILTIAQEPNNYLSPLPKPKAGRSLRKVSDLWPLAGKILLAERMWLKTQRLVAVHLDQPVLSNVWWSFAFNEDTQHHNADKALVLWLNSTLALLMLFATRDETRGAWVDFKKPSLGAMPVLDVRALSQDQLTTLAAAYNRVSQSELQPLPLMAHDDVRAEIDHAIAEALNLPDFSVLRTMLAREPVVCMERI